MRRALVAIAVGFVASTGHAADWWLVGSNSRSALYHDRSSISRDGDVVTQRLIVVLPDLPIRRIEVTERVDCQAKTATDIKRTFVLSDGSVIERPVNAAPRMLAKGTNGWASFRFGCGSDAERASLGHPTHEAELESTARLAIAALR